MPFPSLPGTGAEKGKNTLNTVLFHLAELPMHLPQKSLAFPAMPCLPHAWVLSSGNCDPLVPGTAIPAGAAAGKGILVFSHCLGTMQGGSALKFCPGTRVNHLELFK